MTRLLHKLNQYSDNLTIGELKVQLNLEAKQLKLEEEKSLTSVREKVEGKYFKFIDEGIFDKSLEVLYVNNVSSHERTTDWDLLYTINGSKVSFESYGLRHNEREYSYTEEQFDNMVEISEAEFKSYYDKFIELNEILVNLIKI